MVENIDGEVALFIITGMGPDGVSFTLETAGTSAVIGDLAPGPWVVTAEARNAGGVSIGDGTEPVTLGNGRGVKTAITLHRFRQYGTLEVTVFWDASDVQNPVVRAGLWSLWRRPRFLTPDGTGPGTAFYQETQLPEGWYLLTVVLKDGRRYVNGAILLVRINGDEVTEQVIDFRKTVPDNGTIQVNIIPDMAEPFAVGMRGQSAEISEGQEMTVTSYLALPEGNAAFTWYVNGEPIGIGETMTVGGGLAPGVYRLDVTAFSADGARGGSASWEFRVVQN